MCKVYNSVGSLTTIKTHLYRKDIHDFKSLNDVIDFQNSYPALRQQIISYHQNLIEQEKNLLHLDLQEIVSKIEKQKLQSEKELNDEIGKLKQQLNISKTSMAVNHFQKLTKYLYQQYYSIILKHKVRNLDFNINKSINKLARLHHEKNNRYQFILSQFDNAVKQSSQHSLIELDRKKLTIDELNSFIYGALGEQKVVKTLESLSDECFLINDFAISFSAPIYNKQENDYIKSIQIDHILITPSGVFLIETKNWSKESLENLKLRSPVQQIKRSSFALFKLLNNEMSNYHLHKHHWGDKKISIRNLIVLMNTKPEEEFQYVKILTLNEVIGYVNYFKKTFSNIETERIADYLLNISNKKVITLKK